MIDLTGWSYVQHILHNYRWWRTQETLGYQVMEEIHGHNLMTDKMASNNQNSNSPQVEVINISSINGDDSVMVQFYYFDNDY